MHELTKWSITAVVLLTGFIVAAAVGIRKKNLNLFIISIALLLLSMICGGYTAFHLIKDALPVNP